MQGNALIPLMGEPMNLARNVAGGAVAGNQLMSLIEDRKMAPMRQQAAQMEVEAGKITLSKEKAIEQLRNAAIDGSYIRRDLASGDLNTAISRMEQRNRRIMESGGDNQHTQQWLSALSSRDPAQIQAVAAEMEEIERAYQTYGGGGLGGKSAAEREFEAMTAGMSPQDKEKARRITLGLDPRAMGSSSITIAQQGLTDPVAASQGVIAGSVAGAQQGQKAAYAGEIAANTAAGANAADMGMTGAPSAADVAGSKQAAKETATADAKRAEKAIVNRTQLEMYNIASENLRESLGVPLSGPLVGYLPNWTGDRQQLAYAGRVYLPIIKNLMRTAGEGSQDQREFQALIDLIPGVKDKPEVAFHNLDIIDQVVRTKLGAGATATPEAQTSPMEGKTAVNPQTGQRLIMRNGQWVAQ